MHPWAPILGVGPSVWLSLAGVVLVLVGATLLVTVDAPGAEAPAPGRPEADATGATGAAGAAARPRPPGTWTQDCQPGDARCVVAP